MAKGTEHPENQPLSDDDIKSALEGSGYPFEVSLFHQFKAAGMEPSLGTRLQVRASEGGEPVTREIDLVARRDACVPGPGVIMGSLRALIEAKRMHEPNRFVGIVGDDPEPSERRMLRHRFYGCPSFNLGIEGRETACAEKMTGAGGLVDALQPLNQGPLCVNWTIVTRRKDRGYEPWADNHDSDEKGNKRYVDSMHTLAAASTWNELEHSRHLASAEADTAPHVLFGLYLPTLIVKTPSLHIYDARSQRLEATDWIRLRMTYESAGQTTSRVIDVFSESGVSTMIRVYGEVMTLLEERLRKHGEALFGCGAAIRMRHREARTGGRAISIPSRSRIL